MDFLQFILIYAQIFIHTATGSLLLGAPLKFICQKYYIAYRIRAVFLVRK